MTPRSAAEATDPAAVAQASSLRQRNFLFLAVVLGMLLAALDQTIVATALPTVIAERAHHPDAHPSGRATGGTALPSAAAVTARPTAAAPLTHPRSAAAEPIAR